MKASDLFLFIAKCLNMDNNPEWREEVKRMIITEAISWEDFVWTGSSHYVLPALYSALLRNDMLGLLPVELAHHMERIHALNYRRNLNIMEQCRAIGTCLNHMGIEPLFLKGAGFLLSGLYYDLGDRMMEDIDIWVPEKDLERTMECMSVLGYVRGKSGSEDERYQDHHHLPPLVCAGKAAPVEIHRYPVHPDYARMINLESLFQNRVLSQESNCWLPSLSDQQLILFFHEYHSARGYLSSIPALKGMFDFYLLSKSFQPEPVSLPNARFRKNYRKFIYVTTEFFNDKSMLRGAEIYTLRTYVRRELFLLNHPVWNSFWYDYIYFAGWFSCLIFKSVYSKQSRELILLKVKKKFRLINA
jgi:hypothetical protein